MAESSTTRDVVLKRLTIIRFMGQSWTTAKDFQKKTELLKSIPQKRLQPKAIFFVVQKLPVNIKILMLGRCTL